VRWSAGPDRGDVVLGWLTKLVVVIALVGVAGFDALSIGTSHLAASDDANEAAQEALSSWDGGRGTVQSAYDAAVQYADEHGERIPPRSFHIYPDGSVQLLLIRTATTMVVRHIGPLQHFQVIRAEGSATPAAP
jgi:hypothetical protein